MDTAGFIYKALELQTDLQIQMTLVSYYIDIFSHIPIQFVHTMPNRTLWNLLEPEMPKEVEWLIGVF